jgi:hypothetical protein
MMCPAQIFMGSGEVNHSLRRFYCKVLRFRLKPDFIFDIDADFINKGA